MSHPFSSRRSVFVTIMLFAMIAALIAAFLISAPSLPEPVDATVLNILSMLAFIAFLYAGAAVLALLLAFRVLFWIDPHNAVSALYGILFRVDPYD